MTSFDDLALLRAFVGIVESGSISAAARRLKLPQPTLSRHLRTLEDRCGASLLQRDTHQMSLTETGRRLLADARTLLELAENAEQRLRADQSSLSGHLRVFATIDGGQFIVTRLLSSFLQTNPQVTAELAFTNRPRCTRTWRQPWETKHAVCEPWTVLRKPNRWKFARGKFELRAPELEIPVANLGDNRPHFLLAPHFRRSAFSTREIPQGR